MFQMAQRLNKYLFASLFFCVLINGILAQNNDRVGDKEYKDRAQHERYYRRRNVVSAWQINQLKSGALVVRLKTNQALIDALIKSNNIQLAEQKRLEILGINLNIIRAYYHLYNFSKVYFMYSNFTDTLLKGARAGIFLDTNLAIDQTIRLNEKFYLLAETDKVYNSSIGFVKEENAGFQIEKGSPSGIEFPIVIKNKYGHQLKQPFPYSSDLKFSPKIDPVVYVNYYGKLIPYHIDRPRALSDKESYLINNNLIRLVIPKMFAYQKFAAIVDNLNSNLIYFYQANPSPERSKHYLDAIPFLY